MTVPCSFIQSSSNLVATPWCCLFMFDAPSVDTLMSLFFHYGQRAWKNSAIEIAIFSPLWISYTGRATPCTLNSLGPIQKRAWMSKYGTLDFVPPSTAIENAHTASRTFDNVLKFNAQTYRTARMILPTSVHPMYPSPVFSLVCNSSDEACRK